jgi:hypothetical protein
VDFIRSVTDPDSDAFVPESERLPVLDNDGAGVRADAAVDGGKPHRTLQLVVHHTDGDREFAYDKDPLLGAGTEQVLAAAAAGGWTVIDMAADWEEIYAPEL